MHWVWRKWKRIFSAQKRPGLSRRENSNSLPLPKQLDANDRCWCCGFASQTSALEAAGTGEINLLSPKKGRRGVWAVVGLLMCGDVSCCVRGSDRCVTYTITRRQQKNMQASPCWMNYFDVHGKLHRVLQASPAPLLGILAFNCGFLSPIDSSGGPWIRILNALWSFLWNSRSGYSLEQTHLVWSWAGIKAV